MAVKPQSLDFFAGSGLVTEALRPFFRSAWANDFSAKKAAVFCANHDPNIFHLGSIEDINGKDLPAATLSWASFPCQDLSLAGNMKGIHSSRSGLVWQWLRVMDEMKTRPPLVVAENVVGLVSGSNGEHYHRLHQALRDRGYKVGVVLLDAVHWLPQSRPRVFVVAVHRAMDVTRFESRKPLWCHSTAVRRVAEGLSDWIWWKLPDPKGEAHPLSALIEKDAPLDDRARSSRNIKMVSLRHRDMLNEALRTGAKFFPGYKRTRNGQQMLELRFDDIAGCLRTPEGGSSRQLLVVADGSTLATRLLTVREAARLMGVRDTYRIPGTYNDGYKAMGDAVAVPAVKFLAKTLLSPLAQAIKTLEVSVV